MFKPAATIALAGLLLLAACDKQPAAPAMGTSDAIATNIRADETRWQADWKARDVAKLAAHYADDAVLMIPGQPVARGRAAIEAALNGALADPQFSLTFASEAIDVAASGDMAVSRGRYTETASDPVTKAPLVTRGSYMTLYKPQPDGKWRAVWDINTPAAQPDNPALVAAVDGAAAPLPAAAAAAAPAPDAPPPPAPTSADRL